MRINQYPPVTTGETNNYTPGFTGTILPPDIEPEKVEKNHRRPVSPIWSQITSPPEPRVGFTNRQSSQSGVGAIIAFCL